MTRTVRQRLLYLALSCCVLTAALCVFSSHAQATITNYISFQGKLTNTDGTNVANNSYTLVFSIYTVSSGGSAVWTESKSVTVTDGLFQTNLGDVTSLPGSVNFNSNALYLGVKVGADAEMTPRVQLTAVAQAFNAENLGGIASSGFVQLSPGAQQTGFINISGAITSGAVNGITIGSTIQPSTAGALTVRSNGSNALNLTGGAASTWDIGANTLSIQTTNNGAITLGSGLLTLAGNQTFSGTSARTITGPTTGGLTVTVASGPLSLSTTTSGTLSATSAGALTLTGGAASTWSTTGNLIIQASGTNTLTLNTGGAGTVDLGNTNTTTINIGGTSGATTNIAIGNVAHTVHIGDGGTSTNQAITIGSNNSGSTTTIQGGSVSLTSGANIVIGAVDTTATQLILDTKSSAGDPAGVGTGGGMYYNSSNNRFRCYEASTWKNCTSGTIRTTADRATGSTSYSDVTGLTFAVNASTDYNFSCSLVFQSAATTTGFAFSVNGPASPTFIDYTVNYQTAANATGSTTLMTSRHDTAYNAMAAVLNTIAATTNLRATIEGTISNGTNAGTVAVRFLSEVNASNITVKKGSYCNVY